jgi:hypothetical protein
MRQSSDALKRIEGALTKPATQPVASLLTPFTVTVTTTAKPIADYIPGTQGKQAYYFYITVFDMGTSTSILVGDKNAQVLPLVSVGARIECECPGYLLDMSDVYVRTAVGTATIAVSGYGPVAARDSPTSKPVIQ